ncbi:PPOX class F420-dependent oxidoreductase [Mycobacterium sp. NPDC050041]|uniref:PPOX class F420-dependent oxidoreductase n=1 Tax=Mycobacterium sp. NPDC050041 TaxID=3364293 RepID=UPI003C2C06C0
MAPHLDRLGAEKFVSLTTFKRNGDAVATPLWLVSDGGALVFWTPADSWKVKRVGRDARVTMAACSRSGKVSPGEQAVAGRGEVIEDAGEVRRVEDLFRRKYGLGHRVVTAIERLIRRGHTRRVLIRVNLDD